jgi:hypothetical protein
MEAAAAYPATFDFDPPEKVANWRPLVQWLLVIPHAVILYVLGFVSEVIGLVSWFIVLFTGSLPDGLANLQVMYLRYSLRVYTYAGFMREEYPPFSFESTAVDPRDDARVRVDIAPKLVDRNRLTVAFRIILVIPQFIVLIVLGLVAGVAWLIAFFAVLFTGRWPVGVRDFVLKVLRWNLRVQAYFLLLVDEYPPFALD